MIWDWPTCQCNTSSALPMKCTTTTWNYVFCRMPTLMPSKNNWATRIVSTQETKYFHFVDSIVAVHWHPSRSKWKNQQKPSSMDSCSQIYRVCMLSACMDQRILLHWHCQSRHSCPSISDLSKYTTTHLLRSPDFGRHRVGLLNLFDSVVCLF